MTGEKADEYPGVGAHRRKIEIRSRRQAGAPPVEGGVSNTGLPRQHMDRGRGGAGVGDYAADAARFDRRPKPEHPLGPGFSFRTAGDGAPGVKAETLFEVLKAVVIDQRRDAERPESRAWLRRQGGALTGPGL